MTISNGDTIPTVNIAVMGDSGPEGLTTDDLFKGKKVVLFGVPGAFTPTCSAQHLPGFINNADAIKAKGVDTIACISVNDPFVMGAWGKDQSAGEAVVMVADGSAEFAKATGLEFDLGAKGLGLRNQRYSMIVEDGVVKNMNLDEPGNFEVSSAEKILEQL